MRPAYRLASALLPLLLLLVAAPAHAEDTPAASPFADQAQIDKHLATACDMVEAIKGRKFPTRPTARITKPAELAKILEREFQDMPESLIAPSLRASTAKGLSTMLMAKYEPSTHTIHIVPEGVKLVEDSQPKLAKLGEKHLLVLMAHEVTHAMDFPRYDFQAMRPKLPDTDAQQALNAIVEGHAQFVAEEAAKRWKLTAEFVRLTAAIVGDESDGGTDQEKAIRGAQLAQIRFAYGQGHSFFTAVAKARGEEGVEAALRKPPLKSKHIEQPALWLDPSKQASERDLTPILNAFRWLIDRKPFLVSDQRVLAAGLRAQALRLPPERRKEWLQGFVNAHLIQGQDPSNGDRVVGVVLLFDTEAHAQLFAELDRIIVAAAKPQAGMEMKLLALTEPADEAGKLPGFYIEREIKMMGQSIKTRQQVTHSGTIGIEFVILGGDHLDRSHMDAAMQRAVAWIDDPEAAAKLPALETPKPKTVGIGVGGDIDPEKDAPKKAEPKKEPAGAGK